MAAQLALGSLGADGSSSPISVNHDSRFGSLIVHGTFTANVAIETSPDGANWFTCKDAQGVALSGISAPAAYVIAGSHSQLRFTVSGYASGSVRVTLFAAD